MHNDVQIVILAAGKSTRMGGDEPKALATLKGKPFLRHILDTVDSLDFALPPVIVVGHMRDKVMETIGGDLAYAVQTEQLGTGHAVLSAKDALHPDHGTIFVLSTDQPLVSKETILSILNKHEQTHATITIGTVQLPDFDGWHAGLMHFGRIIRNTHGAVERIVEFKDATDEEKKVTEVNPAIYAFDAAWLWENIQNIKNNNAGQEYYLPDLVHMAFEQKKSVEAVPVASSLEGLQPNTPAELATLEDLVA